MHKSVGLTKLAENREETGINGNGVGWMISNQESPINFFLGKKCSRLQKEGRTSYTKGMRHFYTLPHLGKVTSYIEV